MSRASQTQVLRRQAGGLPQAVPVTYFLALSTQSPQARGGTWVHGAVRPSAHSLPGSLSLAHEGCTTLSHREGLITGAISIVELQEVVLGALSWGSVALSCLSCLT